MSGYPVVDAGAVSRGLVTPKIGITPVTRLNVAAALSGTTAVGTMDTTPTEAEVLTLMQKFMFSALDNVKSLSLSLSLNSPATSAVQAVLVRINGNDYPEDALAFANGYDDVIEALPNTPITVYSDTAITKVSVVALPSGVTGGNYEGAKFFMKGHSHA